MTVAPSAAQARREDLLAVATIAIWAAGAISSTRWGLWLGVGGVALVIGVMLLVLDPVRLRSQFQPRGMALLVGVVAGVVMVVMTYQLYRLAVGSWPLLASATGDLYVEFRTLTLLQSALVLGPVIVGEELAWRGLVQSVLSRRLGAAGGVVVTAVVYALAHAPAGSLLLAVVALICGLYWGILRAATGSLLVPLIAHIMWDTSVLLLWPLPAR